MSREEGVLQAAPPGKKNVFGKVSHGGVARGAGWLFLAGQAERLLGVASIALLARFLSPYDFGIVGTAGAAAAIVEVFGAFGFEWALIRIGNPTTDHFHTAWTLRLAFGFGLCAVISLLAIPAGRFYQNPDITFLLFGIAANGALGSMENIGTVEYRRNLDFSFEFRSRLYSKLSGTFAAVIIAVGLRSYWALILGITASRLFSVIYSYIQCEFRPRIMLTKKRDLLAFSWWMLLSRLVTTISFRFSQLFVGYRFGSASVGHFSMAAELATLATSEVAAPINRVMFSRYSEHGGDLLKITQGFRRISCVIWVIGVPACLGIVVTAPDVIKVLLGPQWKDAAPILQILAIANLFDVMAANTHYVYWAIGRAKFVTALDALTSGSFIILASILALSFGVIGVAVAQAISALLAITINYLTLARTLSVPLLLLLRSQARTLAASFGMTAAVYYIFYSDRGYSSPNALEHLVAAVCSGAAIYILLLYALWMVQRRPDGAESDILQVLRIVLSKYLRPFCGH